MRVELRQQVSESEIRWRVTEADGRLVRSWLPDLEDDDYLPIDRGGFVEHADAVAFALGVDWIRADAGILGDLTTADIDAQRNELDADRRGRPKATPPSALRFEAVTVWSDAPTADQREASTVSGRS